MIHVSVSFRSEDGNAFRMSAACATQREILTCALLRPIRAPLYIRMAKIRATRKPAGNRRQASQPACEMRDVPPPAQTFRHTLDNF
ncbi:hypothetical protein DID96_16705 [Burkholderia sp. Bp8963]|nr:hypothetical protein DID96_16705 [Burkholderia sp. Bp8963]